MKKIEGHLIGTGLRFGIVLSRFNGFIGERLLEGAVDMLVRHGVDSEKVTVVYVPGAFEIPLAAKALAKSGDFDAVITLGAVIKGATAHFDYVAGPLASHLASLAMEIEVPILFGVLTTETIEQAVERAGTKAGNKGADVAAAAIEMANLLKSLRE